MWEKFYKIIIDPVGDSWWGDELFEYAIVDLVTGLVLKRTKTKTEALNEAKRLAEPRVKEIEDILLK